MSKGKTTTLKIDWDEELKKIHKFLDGHLNLRGLSLKATLRLPVWLRSGMPDGHVEVDLGFSFDDLLLAVSLMKHLDDSGDHHNLFHKDVISSLENLDIMAEVAERHAKELAKGRDKAKWDKHCEESYERADEAIKKAEEKS